MSTSTEGVSSMIRRRRRVSAPPAPTSSSCSITSYDLPSSSASPTQTLTSLRLLVLTYLETLERTLSAHAQSASLTTQTAPQLLAQFRASVVSHLPHLWISDLSAIETFYRTQTAPAQLVLDDARDRFHDLDLEFHPSYYTAAIQTLSTHLATLHSHLEQNVLVPGAALFPFTPVAEALEGLVRQASSYSASHTSSDESTTNLFSLFTDLREGLEANMEAITSESSEVVRSAIHDVRLTMHTSLAHMKENFTSIKSELDHELTLLSSDMSLLGHELEGVMDEVRRAVLRSVEGVKLIAYSDLPHEWRNNPFVAHGYRFIPVERWGLIIKSVFEPHNETLNIHTHLIPFMLWFSNLVFLRLGGLDGLVPAPVGAWVRELVFPSWMVFAYRTLGAWIDKVPIPPFPFSITPLIQQRASSSALVSNLIIHASPNPTPKDPIEVAFISFALLCLGASAVWHTMSGCADRRSMEFCARVDYIGIGWLISATVATMVWYGFGGCAEDRIWATVYLAVCGVMGALGNVLPFMDWFNMHKYRLYRIAFFLAMAFMGAAPIITLAMLHSWEETYDFVSPIFPSILSYVLGLLFYATHTPERFLPPSMRRKLDVVGGSSHAIWHCFIVLAVSQHRSAIALFKEGVQCRV